MQNKKSLLIEQLRYFEHHLTEPHLCFVLNVVRSFASYREDPYNLVFRRFAMPRHLCISLPLLILMFSSKEIQTSNYYH